MLTCEAPTISLTTSGSWVGNDGLRPDDGEAAALRTDAWASEGPSKSVAADSSERRETRVG